MVVSWWPSVKGSAHPRLRWAYSSTGPLSSPNFIYWLQQIRTQWHTVNLTQTLHHWLGANRGLKSWAINKTTSMWLSCTRLFLSFGDNLAWRSVYTCLFVKCTSRKFMLTRMTQESGPAACSVWCRPKCRRTLWRIIRDVLRGSHTPILHETII